MKQEELLLLAIGELEDDYLMEANNYHKKNRSRGPGKALLIAACVAMFVITVSAVGVSIHRRAQSDLGIGNVEEIPEYTEYSVVETLPETETEVFSAQAEGSQEVEDPWAPGGEVQLVSAFCSGNEIVAYVRIPDVTPEMVSMLGQGAGWAVGALSPYDLALSWGAWHVEYDAESESALVKVRLSGECGHVNEISMQMLYRKETEETYGVKYDWVKIPVTESTSRYAEIGKTVKSSDIDLDLELVDVEVYAGYVSFTLKTKPYAELMEDLGEDAYAELGNPIYREPVDETWAKAAYLDMIDRVVNAWSETPVNTASSGSVVEGAELHLSDGTALVIAQQESPYAAWHSEGDLNQSLETGEVVYQYTFSTPLVLDEVEAITILGETYLLTGR